MNEPVSLALVPLNRSSKGIREGNFIAYAEWIAEPEFKVEGFPAGLPLGLYRIKIETPNAADVLTETHGSIRRGDEFVPLRVTIERQPGSLHLYFVLPGDASAMNLVLYTDKAPFLRLGAIRLQRTSTTLWRSKRGFRGLQRRLLRPWVLGADVRSGWNGFRNGGLAEVRRRVIDVISPTTWYPNAETGRRIGEFARRIFAQNEAAIEELGAPQGPAASLSIVVPVYRTPKNWLLQLVESLNQQTDQDFEVVFVFDGPQDELLAIAREGIATDFRAKFVTLPANKGVSAATNAGIAGAEGEFILVVDHDDLLERHLVAAFHRASSVQLADIYYADEAITDDAMAVVRYIATRGQFDLRHYLSHPYIVHPIFIRRSLAHEAGLLDETLRVSHDVEFFLRCVAKAQSVVQIPLVLYFWRTHASSLGHAAKNDVSRNTTAAVRSYLEKTTNWDSFEVRPGFNFNELDVRPPLPASAKAAIVIPTKNGKALLSACLDSIYERTSKNRIAADIWVIDHQSDDPATLEYLEAEDRAGRIGIVRYTGPWNYSAINNAALRQILPSRDYTHLVFMNNDIELVTDDWLDRMIAQFSWGDVGVVGCCLEYPDGRVQHGGVVVGLTGAADHSHRFEDMLQEKSRQRSPGHLSSLVATRDYSAVTAALMVVPVFLFDAVGGFDEQLAVGFNDTDLCLRIGALGFHSTYVGGVVAVHHESATRSDAGGADHPEDTRLFEARYEDMITGGDPYYGMQLDWTGTRVRPATQISKRFRLRAAELPPRPGAEQSLETSNP